MTIPASGQSLCYNDQDQQGMGCTRLSRLGGQDATRDLPQSQFEPGEPGEPGEIVHTIGEASWLWAQEFSGALNYVDAKASCPLGWGLPTRFELMTLVDYGSADQWRMNNNFTQPTDDELGISSLFWTDTQSPADGSQYWAVNFSTGHVVLHNRETTARARCVKIGSGQ